jgi:hypothetical protein
MADSLMKAGISSRTILQALHIDDSTLSELERRYNPDQPRIPAGNGRESGQWTDGDSVDIDSSNNSTAPTGADESARAITTAHGIQIAYAADDWAKFLKPNDRGDATSQTDAAAPNAHRSDALEWLAPKEKTKTDRRYAQNVSEPAPEEPGVEEPVAQEPARQEEEQRSPTSVRGASRDVTLYSPDTHQWVTFGENSALVPRLPGYWIKVGALPEGPTYLSAPGSENEAESNSSETQETAPTAADRANARRAQLAANRRAGASWEKSVGDLAIQNGKALACQATVMSYKGNTARADFLTRDPLTDEIEAIEAKSSQTAPLTPKQTLAYPEIIEGGGFYIGADRPSFPRGTIIPIGGLRIARPTPEKFMTIEQTNIIDISAIDEPKGEISLIICDHLPWDIDEGEHLWMLQSKINRYLDAIESGELYQQRPGAIGKHIVIEIAAKYPLSKNARIFVEKCQVLMISLGLELRFEHLASDADGRAIRPDRAQGPKH